MTDEWPRAYNPYDDNSEVDTSQTVWIYPHIAGQTEALAEWAGSEQTLFVNGGPVVVLPGSRPIPERLVGLDQVAVSDGVHSIKAMDGGLIGSRYRRADFVEAPPVD